MNYSADVETAWYKSDAAKREAAAKQREADDRAWLDGFVGRLGR
jgi:hypothetical protein